VASEHPQSRIVTMDGEHMIYLDDPDQVVSQIREFLAATG
jgi:pimeloyl-ACP methyl ester carboxylesterase